MELLGRMLEEHHETSMPNTGAPILKIQLARLSKGTRKMLL